MISATLGSHLQQLVEGVARRGHLSTLQDFVDLEQRVDVDPDLQLGALHDLERRAAAEEEQELRRVVQHRIGRHLAFTLDRPREALDWLVPIAGDLLREGRRTDPLHRCNEVEVLRAYHKIDARGYLEELREGIRRCWGSFGGDLLPKLELLDIGWRTGHLAASSAAMQDSFERAEELPRFATFSLAYWRARALRLEGRGVEALAVLTQHAARQGAERESLVWRLYQDVERVEAALAAGQVELARTALEQCRAASRAESDPMLHWDLAHAWAGTARRTGSVQEEREAWRHGLEVLEGRGLSRLEAEYALELGELCKRSGADSGGDRERARRSFAAALPGLRDPRDLRPRAEALGWRIAARGSAEE